MRGRRNRGPWFQVRQRSSATGGPRLGARRQLEHELEQPMDLEPREQPHAERRRAAAGDEPHKRRA
eukprot:4275151-Prymnesium_polylepis.1